MKTCVGGGRRPATGCDGDSADARAGGGKSSTLKRVWCLAIYRVTPLYPSGYDGSLHKLKVGGSSPGGCMVKSEECCW